MIAIFWHLWNGISPHLKYKMFIKVYVGFVLTLFSFLQYLKMVSIIRNINIILSYCHSSFGSFFTASRSHNILNLAYLIFKKMSGYQFKKFCSIDCTREFMKNLFLLITAVRREISIFMFKKDYFLSLKEQHFFVQFLYNYVSEIF